MRNTSTPQIVYKPRTEPRGHQVTALERIRRRPTSPASSDVFALLMEYGTGKSKVICDEWGARAMAGDLQDLLVFAPAGNYRNWDKDKNDSQQSQFRAHLDPVLYDQCAVGAWVSGASATHKRALERLLKHRGPRILVVNIEAMSSVKAARDLCAAFLAGRRVMMAVDESTVIKSPDSNRYKAVLRLAGEAAARRILTGLVTPNSPLDLYAQMEFLDWRILGFRSFYAFKARHAVTKPIEVLIPGKENRDGTPAKRKVDIIVNYRYEDELQAKIAPYSYRVLKEECLDLPPKVYAPLWDVELTDEQRRIYKELKEFASAELSGEAWVTAPMVLTRLLRMQQVLCGYVTDEEGREHDVPSNRGKALLEIIGLQEGKAIIWCPFHRPLSRIVQMLGREFGPKSTATWTGLNVKTRLEEEARWLGDPDCRFLVATQAAGGRGNTWVKARQVIYFANNFDLEMRLNSEDRAHRIGLQHSVTYTDLIAVGTMEMKIVQALRDKIDMATAISGDNYKSWLI